MQVHSPIFFKTNSLKITCNSLDSREDKIKKITQNPLNYFSLKVKNVKNWIASLEKNEGGAV